MIKYLLIISFFLINLQAFSRDLENFDKFYSILIQLESGGKTNAIGDGGRAIGPAQIHKAYFLDAQQFNKELNKYKYEDCFRLDVSKLVVKSYILRYSNSKIDSFETWAKMHNGGGRYWLNKSKKYQNNLDIYWRKFQNINNEK